MTLPSFSMRQLLEAGVHFGHHTRRWNPKMAPYIFGVRNGVHIIDLEQTVPLLERALAAIRDVVADGGRVLFVGTKRQAADKVAEAGSRCGQYYVNHRWLGGMLTNWGTISKSIKRLRELDEILVDEQSALLTKKELLRLTRERNKLERALGGIKEMGDLPNILFVIDTNKEAIAVAEAKKLGIPIAGVIDSNSVPDGITYPVPGNDDAMRAISLYCDLVADAVLAGLQEELRAAGVDVGAAQEAPKEPLPAAAEAVEEAAAEAAPEPAVAPAAEEAPAETVPEPVVAAAAEEAPTETVPEPVVAAAAEEAPAEAAPEPAVAAAAEEAAAAVAPEPTVTAAAEEAPAEAAPEPAVGQPTAEEAAPEPAVGEPVVEQAPAAAQPAAAEAAERKRPARKRRPSAKKPSAGAKQPAEKKRAAAKKPAARKKQPPEKKRISAKKRSTEQKAMPAQQPAAGQTEPGSAGQAGSRRTRKA